MDWTIAMARHTPAWVYVLLAYLIFIGIKAMKPGSAPLQKLAIIPVLFTVWGLAELIRHYRIDVATIGLWLAALGIGVAIGVALTFRRAITFDRAAGQLHFPGDYTLLPLILLTFAVKYVFGAIAATAPEKLNEPLFHALGIAAYGLFAGIFVGKFLIYLRRAMTAA